jgi:hypothetical protein
MEEDLAAPKREKECIYGRIDTLEQPVYLPPRSGKSNGEEEHKI